MANTSPKETNMNENHFGLVVGLGLVAGIVIGAVVGNVGLGVTYGIIGGALIGVVMIADGRSRGT